MLLFYQKNPTILTTTYNASTVNTSKLKYATNHRKKYFSPNFSLILDYFTKNKILKDIDYTTILSDLYI